MSNTITISKKEYRRLLKASEKIDLLEAGGVDNWEWYSESLNPEGNYSYRDICEQIDEEYKDE